MDGYKSQLPLSVVKDPSAKPGSWKGFAATITKTVNEVNVVFTVTDKHGRYVKNLAKSDFSILDDSKPAEPPQFPQRDGPAPPGRSDGRRQQLGARPFQV